MLRHYGKSSVYIFTNIIFRFPKKISPCHARFLSGGSFPSSDEEINKLNNIRNYDNNDINGRVLYEGKEELTIRLMIAAGGLNAIVNSIKN